MTVQASAQVLNEAERSLEIFRKFSSEIGRVAIFRTRWYPEINDGLTDSAKTFLGRLEINASKIDTIEVSGSWELPLAIKAHLDHHEESISFALALGCVVRGETPHFDILCNSVTTALMNLQMEKMIPIGFGLLTVNDEAQARARMNKGAEAAEAAFRTWLQIRKNK